MTYTEINNMVRSIGLPYAYRAFRTDDPENPPPKPPFIVYFYRASNDLYADNSNYQKIERLCIELYTDYKEPQIEETVTTVLKTHGLTYRREEVYLEDEQMLMNIFTMEVLI